MGYRHAAVWIDHQEARIFRIEPTSFDAAELKAPTHHLHKHPRGAQEPTEHPDDAKRFFHHVTRALEEADEILIVGPSTAKLQLIKYVSKTVPALEPRIVGVETVDHPTDRQFAAYARKYFEAADRMNKPAT
jgi:stalled ribosome rescue protein Dom34